MALEKKRIFIGGLFHSVSENDIREKFSRFGTVEDIDIKVRKDETGSPFKTFGFVNILISDTNWRKCLTTYNKTRWKGKELQVQLAKESFVERFQRERSDNMKQKGMLSETSNTSDDGTSLGHQMIIHEENKLKGAAPGMEIAGKEKWIVGKYGRILPIMNIRRKDKRKVLKMDPSKFVHCVKKLEHGKEVKDEALQNDVKRLTWELQEQDNDITRKRKGIFSEYSQVQRRKLFKNQDSISKSKVDKTNLESDVDKMITTENSLRKSEQQTLLLNTCNAKSTQYCSNFACFPVVFGKSTHFNRKCVKEDKIDKSLANAQTNGVEINISANLIGYESDSDSSESDNASNSRKSSKVNTKEERIFSDSQYTDSDTSSSEVNSDSDMKETPSRIPAFKGTMMLYQMASGAQKENYNETLNHVEKVGGNSTKTEIPRSPSPVKSNITKPVVILPKPIASLENLSISSDNSDENGPSDSENGPSHSEIDESSCNEDNSVPHFTSKHPETDLLLGEMETCNQNIELEDSHDDILDLVSAGKIVEVKQILKSAQSTLTSQLSQTINVTKESEPLDLNNKEPSTKAWGDANQKSSNTKRLQSLRQKQKQIQDKKNVVADALASVDRKSNTCLVFDSDSEEELNNGVPAQKSSLNDELTLPNKGTDASQNFSITKKNISQVEAVSKLTLFEESDDVHENDNDAEDEDMFRIRPEYEGKKKKVPTATLR